MVKARSKHYGAVLGRLQHKGLRSWPAALALMTTAWLGLGPGSVPGRAADPVTVVGAESSPPAAFAAEQLERALARLGHEVRRVAWADWPGPSAGVSIVLAETGREEVLRRLAARGGRRPGPLQPEGFSLRSTPRNGTESVDCWVLGADAAGVLYGGLELAEQLITSGWNHLKETDQNPHLAMRGTKFNIPLDVRTPSYSDVGDPAQHNIGEMWSLDFWRGYLDELARHRYNFISLWSLHPFPSLVRVPEYPDVALADVQRSTVAWQENYSLEGKGFDSPEILDKVKVLRRLSIEEKIAFWREVMQYARDRNIDVYFVTWNIFVYGTEGRYGITDEIGNDVTADYFRRSVRELFLTYPLLKGVGLTTGENMPGARFEEKEEWAFRTYAQGVLDAVQAQPGRKITFIHRQHQSGARDIARRFAPLIEHEDVEFLFSFKYAQAHVYSAVRQPFHEGFVKDIGDLPTIWTLRNDDVYHFRWGAPGFVRAFIRNLPPEVARGFYLGSDQYVWGREFLSTEPDVPRQLEVGKHWYHWMIWGRLGYDPNLSDEQFIRILQARFPSVSGRDLFEAWQEASLIFPVTTGFHWGALDFQWYIEGCQSRPGPAQTESGFHDVNRFITLAPHPRSGCLSIPDYVAAVQAGRARDGDTPLEVSKRLHDHADQALERLRALRPGNDKELRLTLGDLEAMACLGKYYAHKIRGATELALYREASRPAHRQLAVDELNQAARWWRRYASVALTQYRNPVWLNRVGYCDWRRTFLEVLRDVEIAGGNPQVESMSPTGGGVILEAENARFEGARRLANPAGATGLGSLVFDNGADSSWVDWDYEAPREGTYFLEIRYQRAPGQHEGLLQVNGQAAGELVLWTSGGPDVWAWDRKPVRLSKGPNQLRLFPGGPVRVDHLNVLEAGASYAHP